MNNATDTSRDGLRHDDDQHDGTKNPEQLEREVGQARARLGRTASELSDQLSAGELIDQASEWPANTVESLVATWLPWYRRPRWRTTCSATREIVASIRLCLKPQVSTARFASRCGWNNTLLWQIPLRDDRVESVALSVLTPRSGYRRRVALPDARGRHES
ncbi:DUF3618 domain-containing protein [Halomonas sp. DQ26W]|nr:DUF3618 domain-containing protein [Halomonas sp. DQ26W]